MHSQFREFIGDHPTFAHNAKFDNGFLTAADARFCSDEPTALHCSIPVFKHKKPGLPKYSLSCSFRTLWRFLFRFAPRSA